MPSRDYAQAILHMLNDPRFSSFQNYDPELLWQLKEFENFPEDLRDFCFSITDSGSEPYYEDVLSFGRLRYYTELERELKQSSRGKDKLVKV